MENKKYEITTNELVLDGRKFFQVKALKDFGSVMAGKLGGYVEGENNSRYNYSLILNRVRE